MIFISPKIRVQQSPIHRWGVFAIDNILEGEMIEECPMVEIEKKWLEKDISIFRDYRFNFPSGRISVESQQICLGYGSIYNHSEIPNANWYSIYYTPEISTFRFYAIRDIKSGEEIFIWYGNGIQVS
jgi:SET domain-containing protein